MENVSVMQFLMSIVFVFIGSITFYVSAMISGHNIFRDIPEKLSSLLVLIVGFLIFVASPISFIVLAPSVFKITVSFGSNGDNIGNNLDFVVKNINEMHELILGAPVGAFILSSLGVGVVYGCFVLIRARVYLLGKIRKKSGIKYPILTYVSAWDSLLGAVKPGGQIEVTFDSTRLEGELKSFSVKGEAKEIVLKNIKKYSDDGGVVLANKGDVALIAEESLIKSVTVPEKSFNPEYGYTDYRTQSMSLLLVGIGFLFLCGSGHITSNFLQANNLGAVAKSFDCLSLFWVLISLVFLLYSSLIAKQDYLHWQSAVILCPSLPQSLILVVLTVLYMVRHLVLDADILGNYSIVLNLISNIALIFMACALFVLIVAKRKIDNTIKNIVSDCGSVSSVEIICKYFYLEHDYNNGEKNQFEKIKINLNKNKGQIDLCDDEVLDIFVDGIESLVKENEFPILGPLSRSLHGEEMNIVNRVFYLIERGYIKK